ncbi:carbohydrate esterase family 9 protein [Collybia nuda]|uniref:Carbohydrate esterase family 9 protein n=1 Tax=Collybia nuda TaxID=64659 RepID=A0A9P5XZU6_9AGAR|nr:carbohydrate esterase family 9 protein [Collybia nuda]
MKQLPLPSEPLHSRRVRRRSRFLPATVFLLLITFALLSLRNSTFTVSSTSTSARFLDRCKAISTPAGPPVGFQSSSRVDRGSDRQVPGTPPTLIRNAKIWTGAHNGTEVVDGDILLDKGVIVSVGKVPGHLLEEAKKHGRLEILDLEGKWVTPGLVDLHSHIGLSSAPILRGSSETNSHKAPILPWLRSVDGLNTHDAAYELSISGGVTTAQVLPGSGNNIGGQAFLIKLRPTAERSVISRILEPPQTLVGNRTTDHHNWRHMKYACGENPDRGYGQTRMDAAWNFRQAYDEARKIRDAQDAFCARVQESNSSWRKLLGLRAKEVEGEFPENLQWESLVDVLRGRVKLSIHCYEAVDLDIIVRLSNEFKFPVASFHHAGETYLVPELLKKTWGGAPTIALFASNARKKREAYRGSEFAPRVLAASGIPVVMKSDHPVLNSRYLLYEAQQAHYYGLDFALALLSVTVTPAKAAGVGHRVGSIAEGFDADIAVWDSHPLTLGATPTQVYIDGIAQLSNPLISTKPSQLQTVPETPNWDREAQKAIEYEGLPPLRGRKVYLGGRRPGEGVLGSKAGVKFLNVKSAWLLDYGGNVQTLFDADEGHVTRKTVIVRDGRIVCFSGKSDLVQCAEGKQEDLEVIDLQGGSIAPGLTTFGSPIGLVEIRLEPSTTDGVVFDPLIGGAPTIIGGDDAVIRAVDGLQFEGRNALLAYRGGVTRAITAPLGNGFLSGLSTTFDIGATSAVDQGAIVQAETALHVALSPRMSVSVSTQVAALRRLLFDSTSDTWNRVREGDVPLVVNVDSADIMATLLKLKSEFEASNGRAIRMTFVGATEAHLLAHQIGSANVSVVVTSPRPYPGYWESQRIMPGPPLTRHTGITALLTANVNVAIGVMDEYNARNARFDVAWVALEANGTISRTQAIGLATTRLHRALGSNHGTDLVAYRGGTLFDLHAKVAGVISFSRRTIEIF